MHCDPLTRTLSPTGRGSARSSPHASRVNLDWYGVLDAGGENKMVKGVSCVRSVLLALVACTLLLAASPAGAQQRNLDNSVNPTASSVKEQQLLQELQRIQGRGTIPDTKSYVIEQPAGRDWRHFHQVTLRWIGAISIVGMLVLLVGFYLVRRLVRPD